MHTLTSRIGQHVYFGSQQLENNVATAFWISTIRKQCGHCRGRVATDLAYQILRDVLGQTSMCQTKGGWHQPQIGLFLILERHRAMPLKTEQYVALRK
jgi:hypothetical protein